MCRPHAGPSGLNPVKLLRAGHPAAGFSQLLYHFARPPSSSSFERAAGALANGPRQARIVGCCCLPTTWLSHPSLGSASAALHTRHRSLCHRSHRSRPCPPFRRRCVLSICFPTRPAPRPPTPASGAAECPLPRCQRPTVSLLVDLRTPLTRPPNRSPPMRTCFLSRRHRPGTSRQTTRQPLTTPHHSPLALTPALSLT